MRGRRLLASISVVASSVLLGGLLAAAPAGASVVLPTGFNSLSKSAGSVVSVNGRLVCADRVSGRLVTLYSGLPVSGVTVALRGVVSGVVDYVGTNSSGYFTGVVFTTPRKYPLPSCSGTGGTASFAGNSAYGASSASYA
jgi:hypothetical protein